MQEARDYRHETPPAAPAAGPLRLLEVAFEACAGKEFWIGTQRELLKRLDVSEPTVRAHLGVLSAAGVAVWRSTGGGKPGTLFLLEPDYKRATAAIERTVLQR